jgi:hypothetical protein
MVTGLHPLAGEGPGDPGLCRIPSHSGSKQEQIRHLKVLETLITQRFFNASMQYLFPVVSKG